MAGPLIVIDPQPRALSEIFDAGAWKALERLGELAVHEGPGRMPAGRFESHLPEIALLIGQSDMPQACLDRGDALLVVLRGVDGCVGHCKPGGLSLDRPSGAAGHSVVAAE